jgi:hypothetical protein
MAKGVGSRKNQWVPVKVEFRHDVGKATWFVYDWENEELQCRIDTKDRVYQEWEGLHPVLGFTYEGRNEDGEHVSPRIWQIGLTMFPASIGTWMKQMGGGGLYDEGSKE